MMNLLLKKHYVAMFDLQHTCMIINPCHIHNADDILQFSGYPKSAPHACHSTNLDQELGMYWLRMIITTIPEEGLKFKISWSV
jgi:hypothetical protein